MNGERDTAHRFSTLLSGRRWEHLQAFAADQQTAVTKVWQWRFLRHLIETFWCQSSHEGPSSPHATQYPAGGKRLMTIKQPPLPPQPRPWPKGKVIALIWTKHCWIVLRCQRSSLPDYFLGTVADIHWPALQMYCPKPPVQLDWVTVATDTIESRQKKVRNVEKGAARPS